MRVGRAAGGAARGEPFVNPLDLRVDHRYDIDGVTIIEQGLAANGKFGIRQWRRGRHRRFNPCLMDEDCMEGDHSYDDAWTVGYDDLPQPGGRGQAVHSAACQTCGFIDPLSVEAYRRLGGTKRLPKGC